MPLLRSSTLKIGKGSSVKSVLNLTARNHFTNELYKREYEKIISKISTTDIKNCLKSSSSEAQFYSDICNEELKKLREEREKVEKQIKLENEINKRKDTEAAKIVRRLWEEANRVSPKERRSPGATKRQCLKPEDVKKVWQEAKKMSNQAKQKGRKLLAERNRLDTKIHLAKQAVQFCNKFGRVSISRR